MSCGYFLTKIHKCLSAVPRRPVISNCETLTQRRSCIIGLIMWSKHSEYLDHILKSIMQEKNLKKRVDFLKKKLKSIGKILERAVLVTPDVVGLYPNKPHGV